MIELNTEYTYSQICEVLGWKVTDGTSKKAQINEIEKCFEFYHPMNKKTKKEKKSYIFTKQLKEPVKPTLKNSAGNNNKNVSAMSNYITALFESNSIPPQYNSLSNWYFNILYLIDREFCNLIYADKKIKENIEEKENSNTTIEINGVAISNSLVIDYISSCKRAIKSILDKTLEIMQKNGEISYSYGYIYLFEDSEGKTFFTSSNKLNEQVMSSETLVCNSMKESFNLSSKLDGRQLLIQIYNNKELSLLFEKEKVKNISFDNNINKILEVHPSWMFKNYYKALCVEKNELNEREYENISVLKNNITGIVRNKSRAELFRLVTVNKDGSKTNRYSKSLDSKYLSLIEEKLFTTTLPPIEYSEDELFKDIWGDACCDNNNWGTKCNITNDDL